ncbi:MAG: 30S ribosome-binding factor RbfA [Planctomycetota bacterium]
MPAYRNAKVAKEMMREISHLVLYEMKDPGVGFVTFTKVEPSTDLKTAKVFFSTIGDEKVRGQVLKMLRRARAFIQGNVSRRMRLRHTPELTFHFDESIEGAVRICKIIDDVNRPKEGEPPAEEADGGEPPVPDDGQGDVAAPGDGDGQPPPVEEEK